MNDCGTTYLDGFPLRRPVLSDSALVLLHGGGGRHPVEQFPLLAVGALDDLAPGLVVARQHAAQHHKVRAGADGFGNVSRTRAAAVLKQKTTDN